MSVDGVWASRTSVFDILETSIIQPKNVSLLEPGQEIRTELSVCDANKSGWGQAAGIWYFDPPFRKLGATTFAEALVLDALKSSLAQTLNKYRPWCGRLLARIRYHDSRANHNQASRQLELVNGPDDPGLLFITAKCSYTIEDIIPSIQSRQKENMIWDASSLDRMSWLPENAVANPLGMNKNRSDDDHVIAVKVTLFEDGAAAIAVKISHACADAHSLAKFVHEWASTNRQLLDGHKTEKDSHPLFDAHLLDRFIGNIETSSLDVRRVSQAKSLPVHRYDSWISLPEQVPPEFQGSRFASSAAGEELPIADMKMDVTKSHYVIHFTPMGIRRLWLSVPQKTAQLLSHHDVLLAHVWSRIIAARGLEKDEGSVYCNFMVGFRSRIDPPLGDDFVGSPFAVAFTAGRADEVCKPGNISYAAALIRSTIDRFNTSNIGALMHLWAHDYWPTRIWGHMFGKRHLMVTSWMREKVNRVDFGYGGPRFVRMDLPDVDGMVQLMEAPAALESVQYQDDTKLWEWEHVGVDVSIILPEDTMQVLLKDPHLLP